MTDLKSTVHVAADGTVTRGIEVPHRGANVKGDNRFVAAPARPHAKTTRFAPTGMPTEPGSEGVRRASEFLRTTIPHEDCSRHIPDEREHVTAAPGYDAMKAMWQRRVATEFSVGDAEAFPAVEYDGIEADALDAGMHITGGPA